MSGHIQIPPPQNEPVLSYAPGTPERAELKATLQRMAEEVVEIPLIIGGEEVRTGRVHDFVCPHDHQKVLATWHGAGPEELEQALESGREAWKTWSRMPWEERAAVFLKAADLLAGPWRAIVNASTMLGQSKTAHQAEIDAACELADFYRFNAYFAEEIYAQQPISDPGIWNRLEYRPLEGFVYAVSPFNFSSIGGNLCGAPVLMGNVALWKPSHTALLNNYYIMKVLMEAGLPAGVINFIAGDSSEITDYLLRQRDFAGLHFTGSTGVFHMFWKRIGANIANYASYPRIVGETGGKDFILAHPTADPEALVTAMIRGAFEYQGQKCSAASRAYVPESLWAEIEGPLVEQTDAITMGDPTDFTNFMGAVIDDRAFRKLSRYIDDARQSEEADIIAGGEYDDSKGYFIRPTLILARNPRYVTMCEELFGPILTIHVYPDDAWEETLELVDTTSPYALTGAVFARDRAVLQQATEALRHAAGNFYLNDKPTGAVVGQQPFGGSRASGTNDKAGSAFNLLRWITPRTLKENFDPPRDYRYPFMDEA
ncbi:MAG: L-glutamate gamma-semialdehyde dehydrogenase [Gemmatimonadales bacterium]|jgi:1-pyrroline-5-carboxylate dehydrogenase|nr:MAG: L-glutamate gamma-semialdehyde dehydrogenase [Gemmatimonadales bacterium]